MRQHVSVFALCVRMTLPKLLLIIGVMGGVEIFLFFRKVNTTAEIFRFIDLIDASHIKIVFEIGLLLYCAVLGCYHYSKNHSKFRYTIDRLPVSSRSITRTYLVYNFCALMIFIAMQLGLLLTLYAICKNHSLFDDCTHILFISAYRNEVFHGILPLEDTFALGVNLLCLLCISICLTCTIKKSHHGKTDIFAALLIGPLILSFCKSVNMTETTNGSIVLIGITALYAAIALQEGDMPDEEIIETSSEPLAP